MLDIKSKWDIVKSVHYLIRRELSDIPGATYLKTDNLKIEFEDVPPSWCIDGDDMQHNEKTFEIKVSKDINMLLPVKNIEKLFENPEEETEDEKEHFE